jgi:murein DD-endopeptidase MepM/ murein hydrolase activator NlpD
MSKMRIWLFGSVACLLAATTVPAQTYDLPFKAEDFDEGSLKVYWGRAKHSESGVQEWGYDLGAMRYDNEVKKWTEYTVSDSDYTKKNNQWAIYGKKIYAMRDGKVIACWRNAPENPSPPEKHEKVGTPGYVYGGGNGFWIEHADGTRVEYAHMIPGSVPSALCPHNDSLMPSQIASPDVRDAWPHIRVTGADQVTVKKGQFLGRVGNAGTSSAPHLHIHVEQGGTATTTKSGGSPVQINFRRGLSATKDNNDSDPSWKTFAGHPIPPGPILVWPPRTLATEYSRHRFSADSFQGWFDHLTDSGFWLTWIDTYNVGGKNYINHVWHPAEGPWRAHFLVGAGSHQDKTNDAVADGYSPVFVESSVSGGQPRYSAVFAKGRPGEVIMRHGLTTQQHDAELASAKTKHLSPVNVSVVSVGGQRRYTVLYRPESVGVWELKSQIPESDYQNVFDRNKNAGRRPIYLNSYVHDGKPFLSAVFASKAATASRKDRHGMSPDTYQNEWQSATQAGMLTRAVTSFDGAQSQHRFAASWWK